MSSAPPAIGASRGAITAITAIVAIVASVASVAIVSGLEACVPWTTVTTELRVHDPGDAWLLAEDGAPLLKPGHDPSDAAVAPAAGSPRARIEFHARRAADGSIAGDWQPLESAGAHVVLPSSGVVVVEDAARIVVDGSFVRIGRCSAVRDVPISPAMRRLRAGRDVVIDDKCAADPARDPAAIASARFTIAVPRSAADIVEHRAPRKTDAFAIAAMSTGVGVGLAIAFAVVPVPDRPTESDAIARDNAVRLALVGASVGAAAAVDALLAPTLFASDVDAVR